MPSPANPKTRAPVRARVPDPSAAEEWESVYRSSRPEDLPWFSPRLDEDVEAILKKLDLATNAGPILDLGTGPGTFAIELARRGHVVVASDISAAAIEVARKRAGALASRIEWVHADLFDCDWPARFVLIHDRGVYHSMERGARDAYARLVPAWLKPGGHLLVKTFHPDEPGDWGPHRIAGEELRENFGRALRVVELERSRFGDPSGPVAWRALVQKPGP